MGHYPTGHANMLVPIGAAIAIVAKDPCIVFGRVALNYLTLSVELEHDAGLVLVGILGPPKEPGHVGDKVAVLALEVDHGQPLRAFQLQVPHDALKALAGRAV